MSFANVSKNQMLDAFTANVVSLHFDTPGADGTGNEISNTTAYDRQALAWNAAGAGDTPDGERRNDGAIVFNITGGGGNNSKITHVGLWIGATFKASSEVIQEVYGADGTYTLPDDLGIKIRLNDPAV